MKIRVINRIDRESASTRRENNFGIERNMDPDLHHFGKTLEYKRALNAAKLDRMYAKPFVASFEHAESVTCIAKSPTDLNLLLSGSADGEIRLWNPATRRLSRKHTGHTRAVRGITVTHTHDSYMTCSDDCTLKIWKISPLSQLKKHGGYCIPAFEWIGKHSFLDVDHHPKEPCFVTASNMVHLWEHSRKEPVQTFSWGADSAISVKFNNLEQELFVTSGSDRSVTIFDLRMSMPIRKIILQTRTNSIDWNPLEAFNFTTANENSNLYTFDMRKLKSALCVHQDFVSSVLDVDYSPTGREFVAGSFDRSIRIYPFLGGHCREVYHTSRMQRVLAVAFSMDGEYVFCGSDDMNVRMWKAHSAQQSVPLSPHQKYMQNYNRALICRYQHLPEVKRIMNMRRIPKNILKIAQIKRSSEERQHRKLKNCLKHSKTDLIQPVALRKRHVLADLE